MSKNYSKTINILKTNDNQPFPSEDKLHVRFERLAELVDTVATARHIETMEAFQICNRMLSSLFIEDTYDHDCN